MIKLGIIVSIWATVNLPPPPPPQLNINPNFLLVDYCWF